MVESKADMKRIFMMSALAAMAACGEQDVTPAEGSQTGFALSFFRNVNAVTAPEENIVVSPYSAVPYASMSIRWVGISSATWARCLRRILLRTTTTCVATS